MMINKDYLNMLVCVKCKGKLEYKNNVVICTSCGHSYEANEEYIEIYDKEIESDEVKSVNAIKEKVREGYTIVNESLESSGFSSLATFLNLGYVPNDNPQYSKFEIDRYSFNKNSSKLSLETIGDYDINGKRVLEVGCGRGGNIATMNKYFKPHMTVGIDICHANIKFCNKTYQIERGFFCVADAENIPLGDGLFDAVVNIESSDLYPNIYRFYDEVSRLLKVGGYFLYAVLLPVDKFIECEKYLESINFTIERNQDITENVLISCREISKKRMSTYDNVDEQKNVSELENFLAAPGSRIYEDMNEGIQVYKILKLKKVK